MRLTQAEFARSIGVTRAAITKLIKKGVIKKSPDGFIDKKEQSIIDYLERRQKLAEINIKRPNKNALSEPKVEKSNKEPSKNSPNNTKINKNEDDLENKTPNLIPSGPLFSHSTQTILNSYISPHLAKSAMDVERLKLDATLKNLMLKEKRGELIKKNLVKNYLNSYLEILNQNILNFPGQIIDHMISLAKSKNDTSREDILSVLTSNISLMIKNTKNEIAERLKKIGEIEENDKDRDKLDKN